MSELIGFVVFAVAVLVVVLVHEGGHFISAKAFGIKVEQFFVGFGPRLWSMRRGETEYGVKVLPFGGYVRIAGMNPFEEIDPAERPRTFGAKPAWQRAVVILSGPLTHFVMAAIFLFVLFVAIGTPSASRPVIDQVFSRLAGGPSPAAAAGLRPGDEIVALDGRPVGSIYRFSPYVRSHVGRPVAITVLRDGRRLTVHATPVLSTVEGDRAGRVGVMLGEARERAGPVVATGRAVIQTGVATKEVVLRLGDVFGPTGLRRIGELLVGTQRRAPGDPASIVGATRLAGQAVGQRAWDVFFGMLIGFNIFVGILNLVPLPPLDGGHLAVIAYEKVLRRKPDLRKLVPLTAVVAGLIILLVASLVYIDITNPPRLLP